MLVLLLALLYAGADHFFHLFEIPELKTLDLFFKWRTHFVSPQSSIKDITIIGIDEESLAHLNKQWPFRRSVYADLIEELIPFEPRVICFDFVFAGEDIPEEDARLARAIRKAQDVIVSSFVGPDGRSVSTNEEIRRGAQGQGVVNKAKDPDNTVRRARTFYWTDTNPFAAWSWELSTLIYVKKLDPATVKAENGRLSLKDTQGKDFVIPILPDRTFDINPKAVQRDFRVIPFWKVLARDKDVTKEAMGGNIILIGFTSRLFHDEHPTPLEHSLGVFMNANALLTLLDRDFLTRIPDLEVKAVGVVTALAVSLLAWTLPLGAALTAVIFLIGASAAASLYALIHNFRGDFFSIPFLMIASFFVTSFYRQIAGLIENVRLRREAITDPLTGLFTRRFLEVMLVRELAKIESHLGKRRASGVGDLCVLMIDVDHFKSVNDTFGHDEGDRALRAVADLLRKSARKSDVVARFGGEEFTVVLTGTGKEEGFKVAEKIRAAVEQEVKIQRTGGGQSRPITISIGVASAAGDNLLEYETILKAADQALYQSKASGRNRVTCI